MSVRADLLTMNSENFIFFQKTGSSRGFDPFFDFDVKTQKLYFFSEIILVSKEAQKSRSTCP